MTSIALKSASTDKQEMTLDELYMRANLIGTTPGFLPGIKPIMGAKETSEFRPAHWKYAEVRALLDQAGALLDPKLAERRTLVLRNPKPDNDWATSRTLVSAYQMILPGEVAPSHRHSSNALRLIIDARGTFSLVNGSRMPMESGDVVLTPGSHWHGHGHEGKSSACWLDVLDVPLTYLLEPMYFEDHPGRVETVTQTVTQSPFRFAWADTLRQLDEAVPDPSGVHGQRIVLPTPSMPHMGLSMQRFKTGTATTPKRTTANRIYSVVQGDGSSQVGESAFTWSRGDTFVAPFWNTIVHHPQSDAVLFEATDQPLMEFVNNYREEVG